MDFKLDGKKAIVTGGAKGLCNGMAQALHDAGAEVVLVDILDIVEESAKKMNESGARVHFVKGDLSDEKNINRIYEECLDKLGGRIDILLNGAGIQYRAPAVDFPADRWKKILDVNLSAVFFMAQKVGKKNVGAGIWKDYKRGFHDSFLWKCTDSGLYCKQGCCGTAYKGLFQRMGRTRH